MKQLIQSYFKKYFEINPTNAFYYGLKIEGHAILNNDFIKKNDALVKEYKKKLSQIKIKKLNEDDLIDYELFKSHLIVEEVYSKLKREETDPNIYLPHEIIQTILLINVKDKKSKIIKRIPNMIENLKVSKLKLKKPIDIWTKNAIITCENKDFFTTLQKSLKFNSNEKKEITKLKNELKSYSNYLSKLKYSKNYSIGKKNFELLLKHSQFINIKIPDLKKLGEDSLKENYDALKKIAKKHNKSINGFLDEIETHTISKNQIINTIKKILAEHKKYANKTIFKINHKETLKVIETPKSMRHQFPTAVFFPPVFNDKKQIGVYNITPSQNKEVQKHMNYYQLRTISAHEGYPGHHLQMSYSNSCVKKRSLMREMNSNIPLIEGWALYIEKLLVDLNYLNTDYDKFLMHFARILRSCRVIIDINTQLGKWTFKDAVKCLEKYAKLPKVRAVGEALWYSMRPTYPLSYLVGAKKIEQLRDKYVDKLTDYNKFHRNLLKHGNIPLIFIEKKLKNTYDTK